MVHSDPEDLSSEDDQFQQNLNRPIQLRLRPPRLNMQQAVQQNPVQPVQQNFQQPQQIPIMNYPPGFHMSILNEIPRYEGNPTELSEFIRAVEDIYEQFYQPNDPNAYVNKLLLSATRNRLKSSALEVITGQTILSWPQLKAILIENFGDQRSELNLIIDVSRLKQNSKEHPVEFYNRCRSLLAILNSKISLTNDPQVIKDYRIADAKALALKSFTSGLLEPLGSFLRSRAPPTLENALTIVKEELDVRYFQNSQSKPHIPVQNTSKTLQFPRPTFQNYQTSQPRPFIQNYQTSQPRPFIQNYQTSQPRTQQNYFPRYSQTFQPNPTPVTYLNPNQPPSQFPGFKKPFGKPGQNVFAPKKNYQSFNKPEPMVTSTVKKRPASQQIGNFRQRPFNPNFPNQNRFQHSSNNFINNNQRANFEFEELHNVNTDPQQDTYDPCDEMLVETDNQEYFDYSEYPEYFDMQNDPDDYQDGDENFQLPASEQMTN
jgi:hypothetical protein